MTNTVPSLAVIILAAGKGTRMKSGLPKVLHKLAHRSMIEHVMQAAKALSPERLVLVIAPGMDAVQQAAEQVYTGVRVAVQQEQLGTGHAVRSALSALEGFDGDVLVVYGDTPLLTPQTLAQMMEIKRKDSATIVLLGMKPVDPTGYGRLIMQPEPYVSRIVEEKDASAEEKHIPWVWGGVMAFDAVFLKHGLEALAPSPVTGEYYLTALLEMADQQGLRARMVPVTEEEVMGVNSRAQLAEAEAVQQTRLRQQAMENGATLVAPETVFLCSDTKLGKDVLIHPHVVFGPGVEVADNVEIRSFSHIEKAKIGAGCIVGPFARLRPGTVLEQDVHIGNFVELKATHAQTGAKINHLSYVGDTEVGAGANVGAGTITCNYDGVHKHRTDIGAGAFIGSNTSLVAPVTIGANAVVGAGSVITEDVPADALAIERSAQMNIQDGAERLRQKLGKRSG